MKITKKELVKLIKEQTVNKEEIDLKYIQTKIDLINSNFDKLIGYFKRGGFEVCDDIMTDQVKEIKLLEKKISIHREWAKFG